MEAEFKPMRFMETEDSTFIGHNEVERLIEVSVDVSDNGDEFVVDGAGMRICEIDGLEPLSETSFSRSVRADIEGEASDEYRRILTAAMNRHAKRVSVDAV